MRPGPVEAHKIMIIQRVIGAPHLKPSAATVLGQPRHSRPEALLGNIAQLSAGLTRLMTVPNSFNRIKTPS